ncbi:hypothetical protein RRG08_046014 [Elysia crispata]|uniref:Uncharacterized protein n=1 Tax=Elysia crispata TaxID=231223 RepID=A0AAE0ZC66_9GAST|nr:hypothetical protein RRG08_046014 [Elysia crispata]
MSACNVHSFSAIITQPFKSFFATISSTLHNFDALKHQQPTRILLSEEEAASTSLTAHFVERKSEESGASPQTEPQAQSVHARTVHASHAGSSHTPGNSSPRHTPGVTVETLKSPDVSRRASRPPRDFRKPRYASTPRTSRRSSPRPDITSSRSFLPKLKDLRLLVLLLFLGTLLSWMPLTCSGIGVAEFFPFGKAAGDNTTEHEDDGGSGRINLNVSFPFFGSAHEQLYVSK